MKFHKGGLVVSSAKWDPSSCDIFRRFTSGAVLAGVLGVGGCASDEMPSSDTDIEAETTGVTTAVAGSFTRWAIDCEAGQSINWAVFDNSDDPGLFSQISIQCLGGDDPGTNRDATIDVYREGDAIPAGQYDLVIGAELTPEQGRSDVNPYVQRIASNVYIDGWLGPTVFAISPDADSEVLSPQAGALDQIAWENIAT